MKQFCFEFLQASITPTNSLRILEAASLYRNEDLENEVQLYMSDHLDEVAQTDEFKSLSKEKLIDCISTLNQSKAKSPSIYQAIVAWIYHKNERKVEFSGLFKMINLQGMKVEFLEETVLEEELVETNFNCQKLALKAYRKLLLQQKLVTSESKLLSVGGVYTPTLVKMVFVEKSETESSRRTYPDLMQGLRCHSSLKLDDYIYVIGGKDNELDVSNVWRLNLKNQSSKWEQVASMNEKRSSIGAAVYEKAIVVSGSESGQPRSTEAYLATFNEWKILSPMNQERHGHCLVVCNRFVYALGGYGSSKHLSSAEKLENLVEDWKFVEAMKIPRSYFAAVSCNGKIYAIGGISSNDDWANAKTVEKYNPATNQWKFVNNMTFPRMFHAASVLRGKIYVVGGTNPDGKAVKKIECYDPNYDTWSVVGKTTNELFEHGLVTV